MTSIDRNNLYRLENFDSDRGCFACGRDNPIGLHMEFYTDGVSVYSWVTIPEQLCGWRRIIHGGITTTIMDEVMSWTAHHILQKLILTRSINVEFLRPLYVGRELRVQGRIERLNSEREAVLSAEVVDETQKTAAQATGVFALLAPKIARRMGVIDETIISGFEKYMANRPDFFKNPPC